MTALQTYESLNPLYELSKADLISLSERQIEEINDSGSAEKAFAFLHKITTLCDLVKKGILDSVINEVEKGNDSAFGLKMKVMSKATNDYSNNPLYLKLKNDLDTHTDFLKGLKQKITEVDPETGEITEHLPPIKKYSTYIKTEF